MNAVTNDPILVDLELFRGVVIAGLKNLIGAEKEITKYDSIVGDGDCGIGLKRGAESISPLGHYFGNAVAKDYGAFQVFWNRSNLVNWVMMPQ